VVHKTEVMAERHTDRDKEIQKEALRRRIIKSKNIKHYVQQII